MERLSLATLVSLPTDVGTPRYDIGAVGIGIVHFGPSAFFRAHVAAYIDTLLERDPRWGVSAVALRTPGVRNALAPQDGLYTIELLAEPLTHRVIGAVRELLVASEDEAAVARRLRDPATRLVTLTITEKGYCLAGDGTLDLAHPDIRADLKGQTTSAIGWIVRGLADRQAAGLPPFVVMSCDNLGHNGAKLRAAVIALAAQTDTALADWIGAQVKFPATMVDSITPATDDALRARVGSALRPEDAWPVQREAFTQWVIEDVPGLPDFASTGATVTCDISGYEQAKLRLLNGAHSSLAYLGLLRGHAMVRDAMRDPELAAFIAALMREDIAPTLVAPKGFDTAAYIDAVLGRFANPYVAHALTQIAGDGTQKLPYRLIDTIADLMAEGRPTDRPTVAIAAWMLFVEREALDGVPLNDAMAAQLAEIGRGGDRRAFFKLGIFERLRPVEGTHLEACERLAEGSLPA